MTKLEFIDKYIELLKTNIESSKELARIYYANDDYEFGKIEEENRVGYEEELEMFQQIKQDLEAWEVIKKCLFVGTDSWDEYSKEDSFDYIGFTVDGIHPLREFTFKEIEIIKKALEVKNNG